MNKYLLAKLDLSTFNNCDLQLLAKHYSINSADKDDLLWTLAYKIHGNQRAEMPPGCLNKYDLVIGEEDIPNSVLVNSNGICWDADILVEYITQTAIKNEYPSDAFYYDKDDNKITLAGKQIYNDKSLQEIYEKATPDNIKKLQEHLKHTSTDVLTPEIMGLVKKTGAILQGRGPIFLEWIQERWPDELIKEWITKVHSQTTLEPPKGMTGGLKEKIGFDKSQMLGEFYDKYREWSPEIKVQLALIDNRLKESTIFECAAGTFCMKMLSLYLLDAYNVWATKNGYEIYNYEKPDDYSGLRNKYGVYETAGEYREPFMIGEHLIGPGANLAGAQLQDADLENANLESAILTNANLAGAILSHAMLRKANFTGADLTRSHLEDVDAQDAIFDQALLLEAGIISSDLRGATLKDAFAIDVDLYNNNLEEADFTESVLSGANFENSDLSNVIFIDASLEKAEFMQADLSEAAFGGAILQKADLRDVTNLTAEQLLEAKDLYKVNLSGLRLDGFVLPGIILQSAKLEGTVLNNADLTGANLSKAMLKGAQLVQTVLKNANLTGANLTGADLTGANLTGANLTGAILTDADFSMAIGYNP